ncbi:hypothetical protein PF008_g21278 [Phytophthora fragariae]|uniref:Rab-GAP TBC domain-containing protein n=1 Tax=Phytophthora fragariae TaxID=53985 RepID=A0A6G0QY76_9STRA|nr:hypothetical protein PF008_g21278 [Phytophthora fragariae]
MESPSSSAVTINTPRTASSQLTPSELSIFPAFTPDLIRLAELAGSSLYSPPVSPRGAETREIFAAVGKGQAFFELLEARDLSLVPTTGSSEGETPTGSGRIDVARCVDGRRRTLLHQACRSGNVQVAKCLLFHGANASARCRDGRTPFHNAAASTRTTALGLLKLLYEHDPTGIAAVDANGSHVLHLAAIHGNLEAIQWCAEARGLPRASTSTLLALQMTPNCVNKSQTAAQGRYYGVQDLVLSGSSHVWRHPRFALSTVFRAPESLSHTQVTIAVYHETQGQCDSSCVGRLSLSLLDLVQGMPAKMQWLPLVNVTDPQADGGVLLLRTLFLPNGISELPHPTVPNMWGSTAEELLSTPQTLSSEKGDESGSPPSSSCSTASTSSTSSCSSSSQFSHPSALVDRLGFAVFDPEMQLRNGEWCSLKVPSGATRSYAYYQLLIDALERQQETRWRNLRCKIHTGKLNDVCSACYVKRTHAPIGKDCDDFFGPEPCSFDPSQRREVRALVWQGIPMSRRSELYSQMSGAASIQRQFPRNYFDKLAHRLEDPTDAVHSGAKNSRFAVAKKQIQVDLKRTFAGNDECWLTSDAGQQSLQRVLLAYALHNDDLGYCQSMTFVVGRLLCLFHSQTSGAKVDKLEDATELPIEAEERVFWLLHVLCEDLFPSYYTQGMTGLQVDGAVLEKLVRMRLPKLYRHFQQLHTPPMGLVLVTQWLLPLCCAVFPSEITFRFLDVLFYEGSSVVFAVAIALLRISQHELLADSVDYTQLFRFLRARDQRLHDAPLLMEVAFEEHQLLAAQVGPMRQQAAQELGIDQDQRPSQPTRTKKLSKLPVDELRPGDVDISV